MKSNFIPFHETKSRAWTLIHLGRDPRLKKIIYEDEYKDEMVNITVSEDKGSDIHIHIS